MKCDISMSVSMVESRPREGMLAVVNMITAYPCHVLTLCSCWPFPGLKIICARMDTRTIG